MRKIILLLSCIIGLVAFSTAQTNVNKTTSNYIYTYEGTALDTTGAVGTTWKKAITYEVPDACYYNTAIKLKEITAFTATVKLQGKVFNSDAYEDITTVTYTGTGTDTTIVFRQDSLKKIYRTYNVLVTRTGGKGEIEYLYTSLKK